MKRPPGACVTEHPIIQRLCKRLHWKEAPWQLHALTPCACVCVCVGEQHVHFSQRLIALGSAAMHDWPV
eukprot:5630101-Amphidinium_carterae.2